MIPAILLGGSVNTVWVARTLAKAGVEVTALSDGVSTQYVRHSRRLAHFVDVPSAGGTTELWWDWLHRHRHHAVVIPCGDAGLEFIALRRRELVELGYLPIEANDGVLLDMIDKERTYALAASVGVEAPRTLTVRSLDELRAAVDSFTYPCALKPVHSHLFIPRFRMKAVVANTRGELEAALSYILPTGLKMLITEIIPGVDDSCCSYYTYIDDQGEPLVHFTKLKLRQRPVGFGIGTYHMTGWVPDAMELGLQFFRGIGLRGIGSVEFKRDARDGRLKLIECTPRLTQADELVRRAGIDFAMLAYERAAGRPGVTPNSYRSGLRLWYPVDDYRAFLAYRRQGRMTFWQWISSVAHPQSLPLLSLEDPGPSLTNAHEALRRVARRLARAATGRDTRRSAPWESIASAGVAAPVLSAGPDLTDEIDPEVVKLGA